MPPRRPLTAVARRGSRAPRGLRQRAVALAQIRLLVLDADGVLTDGRLHYGPAGERVKVFHVRDGFGIQAVQAAGIAVAVISGRRSAALRRRCAELGVRLLEQGVQDKGLRFAALLQRLRLQPRQCACVGDDVPDVPLLSRAGLAVAVADAHPAALAVAHRRTRAGGGAGAVREVCDWLLAAHRAGPARRPVARPSLVRRARARPAA